MKIALAAQMREIDRRAIAEYGIPGVALMQSAGEALARACVEELGGAPAGRRVAMVCGVGSNGGDGFVAARHLANAGATVEVFLAGTADDLKGDAAAFFPPLPAMGLRVASLTEANLHGSDFGGFHGYDLIGDALFGTGFRGAATGIAARLIARMNETGAAGVPVVACDIPSGVNADTGDVDGPAVNAARTVTFALPKMGLLTFPGRTHTGRITVADIGIPSALLTDDAALPAELTTQDWMRRVLPPRVQGRDANKGTFGTVLVIAGAAGMAGAAALSALSALRAGAGLVMLAVPESVLDTAAALVPEAVLRGLPETPERTHGGPGAVEAALELAEKASAVAIGPGMRGTTTVASFVQSVMRRAGGKPIVVDADGLNAIVNVSDAMRAARSDSPTVLTPHPAEMGRLLGTDAAAVQADRRSAAAECAEKFGAVALLKGARTLIADPDGRLAVNRLGSPALATAGSGDVLTGVIAAFLGQGMAAFDAARAGAFLHALAGERAASEMGAAGVIAGDVRDRLPPARQMLYEHEGLDEL